MRRVALRKVYFDGDFRKHGTYLRGLKIGFVGKRGIERLALDLTWIFRPGFVWRRN